MRTPCRNLRLSSLLATTSSGPHESATNVRASTRACFHLPFPPRSDARGVATLTSPIKKTKRDSSEVPRTIGLRARTGVSDSNPSAMTTPVRPPSQPDRIAVQLRVLIASSPAGPHARVRQRVKASNSDDPIRHRAISTGQEGPNPPGRLDCYSTMAPRRSPSARARFDAAQRAAQGRRLLRRRSQTESHTRGRSQAKPHPGSTVVGRIPRNHTRGTVRWSWCLPRLRKPAVPVGWIALQSRILLEERPGPAMSL